VLSTRLLTFIFTGEVLNVRFSLSELDFKCSSQTALSMSGLVVANCSLRAFSLSSSWLLQSYVDRSLWFVPINYRHREPASGCILYGHQDGLLICDHCIDLTCGTVDRICNFSRRPTYVFTSTCVSLGPVWTPFSSVRVHQKDGRHL
jgi:hypothetical protein